MKLNLRIHHAAGVTLALALGLPAGANAAYLCNDPPTAADRHACELARQDDPTALRLYIQRTESIYRLYMPDYISPEDTRRWEVARNRTKNEETQLGTIQEPEIKPTR
jgi:hypothetical protein